MSLVTEHDIRMKFKGHNILIPAGTEVDHQTALGYDENYTFVKDLSWIDDDQVTLQHDADYYGIQIDNNLITETQE